MKYNSEWFIQKARKVHGNKYDYSKINYKNSRTKMIIGCPIHGEFLQDGEHHLRGQGCPKCGKENNLKALRVSKKEFIERANKIHNNKYDYSKVEYKTVNDKVTIVCPIHGIYIQSVRSHLYGCGCPKCANEHKNDFNKKSTEEFIKEANIIHNNRYSYIKTQYFNAHTKVIIICPEHGEFYQTPNHHLKGCGCPKCMYKNQTRLYEKLKEFFPNEEILFEVGKETIPWLEKQRFDIYFPKYNIAVEYNGKQHYIPVEHFGGKLGFEDTLKRDELKKQKCKENNCILFEVKYDYTEQEYQTLVNKIQNIINNY